MSKLILGLDLSSTKTGYCILDTENKKIIESGTIDLGGGTLRERLAVLRNDIRELESTYYFHSCYCERLNPTMSKQTSFAFGALMGFIWTQNPYIQEVKPIEWRKIVYRNLREWDIKGIGREKQKALAIKEVKRRFNYEPHSDDEAEAILIAVAGSILG